MKRRIFSLLMCFVLLFSCWSISGASADDLNSLNQQKDYLNSKLEEQKREQARLAQLLAEAKGKINNQLNVIALIYGEINAYQSQISTLSALMLEYVELAKAKQLEIDRLNTQIEYNFKLFKERLVFAQESGSIGYIDFILGSEDLSDIISRSEVINDMFEYDRRIIESLLADRKAVEEAKKEVEDAMRSCEERQTEQEGIVQTLHQKVSEAQAELAKLKNDQSQLTQANAIIANEQKKAQKELEEVIKRIAEASKPKPAPSKFIWPLPAATPGYITQHFGNAGHTGLDIGVGGWSYNGKIPAVAVAGGKVVGCTSHWSWGNYVLIDHGGGYITRYAHLASFNVRLGQTVVQGQTVGMIGSTGNSTGPHLHLEFYAPVGANGSSILTNPLNYFKKP